MFSTCTSPDWPSAAGATTIAAAPSPKIILDVRTAPILSENFSTQTSSTGRSISWSSRTASERPYGKPAQAATMSAEQWVCRMPSSPESHVDSDGISRSLVQVATSTAPISSAERPACASAPLAAASERWSMPWAV